MSSKLTSTEYEQLTQRLLQLITARATVDTTRLEHDVQLRGRSTTHQVDVLWEFAMAARSPRRTIIECRMYKDHLKQKDVFAFSGVVRDLDTPEMPTTGVMVTTNGYQSGARSVADTYGVVILQLREPTPADLKNRLTQVRVTATLRMPFIGTDVNVEVVEAFADSPTNAVPASEFGLLLHTGGTILLQDFLWTGALGILDEPPVAPHKVTREFAPPAILTLRGQPLARITKVSATVGEVLQTTVPIIAGGRPMAWMIANVLDGTRVWFTDTDRSYLSDDLGGGLGLASEVILGRRKAEPTSSAG